MSPHRGTLPCLRSHGEGCWMGGTTSPALSPLVPLPAQGSWPSFPAVSAVGSAPGCWTSAQSSGGGWGSWGLGASGAWECVLLVRVAVVPLGDLLDWLGRRCFHLLRQHRMPVTLRLPGVQSACWAPSHTPAPTPSPAYNDPDARRAAGPHRLWLDALASCPVFTIPWLCDLGHLTYTSL